MSDAWFDWTYDGRGWYLVNDPEVTFYGEEEAMEYCDERNRATIEAQAAEIEDLKKSLEIWIFNYQRRDGAKPDKARAYAKAWMFRNANGEEPE
jgi:hypothetical protein